MLEAQLTTPDLLTGATGQLIETLREPGIRDLSGAIVERALDLGQLTSQRRGTMLRLMDEDRDVLSREKSPDPVSP